MSTALSYVKIAFKPRGAIKRSFEPIVRSVEITPSGAWLAAYADVTGLSAPDGQLPITALQVLAGPLHLELLSDSAVPRSALGLVHLRNVFEQWGELPARATWEIRATASATMSDEGKLSGVTIRTEAFCDGTRRWSSDIEAIWPMRREGGKASTTQLPIPADAMVQQVHVKADIGRRYARVSGDYNPIHLHAASAKLFGFPKAIAHGMWTVARALAAFDTTKARRVEARFRKPVLLPADLTVFADASEPEHLWVASADGERRYLEMTISEPTATG